MSIDGEIFNWEGKPVNNIRKIMRFRNPQQQEIDFRITLERIMLK